VPLTCLVLTCLASSRLVLSCLACLQVLPTDEEVTLRVFVDRTLIEAYWMDGRVAMTSAIHSRGDDDGETPQVRKTPFMRRFDVKTEIIY
jgi:hypothetical protein